MKYVNLTPEAVHGPGIRETNARAVIAAAPELLVALRWAMRELGERGVATAEYRNARIIIAKASGN